METIAIFGATGTIGAYTALSLKKKGYNVIAVGRRTNDNGFFENNGIKYFSVDITQKEQFKSIQAENVDTVIHLAGTMPATMSGYNPQEYIDSVVTGTLNVLNYCLESNAKKIIFAQSRADSNYLMGKTPIPSDIVKKFPLTGDHSVYSICKNAAVDLIEHYYQQYGLKRFILRLPTIYAYHPNPYFFVNGKRKWMGYRLIIEQALRGKTIEIWGDPSMAKEIVYIEDTIQVIERCITSKLDGGVYNVGRGVPVTLEEQILGIVDVFCEKNHRSKVIYKPEMPNAREYVNDISKTQMELGYEPQYAYKDLLMNFKKEMETEPFEKLWGRYKDFIK
jgi:UDP-glucose 4-epimerase